MEHRKFSRTEFTAPGSIVKRTAAGEKTETKADCEITEISLKGAKVVLTDALPLQNGDSVELTVELEPDNLNIEMKAEVVYHGTDYTGLKFFETDLDSITHLRRLLELNTAESESIERELEFLKEE
jgi:c-di-GMP-binding flagellar brake protein YcgR